MTDDTDYTRVRHCVSDMQVHVVFTSKYRRSVSNAEHIAFLETVFAAVCDRFGARLVECDGEDDHVHLLVMYPPKVAVSTLVSSLKGGAAAAQPLYRARTPQSPVVAVVLRRLLRRRAVRRDPPAR